MRFVYFLIFWNRSTLHKTNIKTTSELTNGKDTNQSPTVGFSMLPLVLSTSSSSSSSSSSSIRQQHRRRPVTSSSSLSSSSSQFQSTKPRQKQQQHKKQHHIAATIVTTVPIVVASTKIPIDISTSIGATLLKKMGWKEGKTINKRESSEQM